MIKTFWGNECKIKVKVYDGCGFWIGHDSTGRACTGSVDEFEFAYCEDDSKFGVNVVDEYIVRDGKWETN